MSIVILIVMLQMFGSFILSSLTDLGGMIVMQMRVLGSILRSNPLLGSILLIDVSMIGVAGVFHVVNNKDADRSSLFFIDIVGEKKPPYLAYTAENYEATISALFDKKPEHFIDLAGFSLLFGAVLPGGAIVHTLFDGIVNAFKFSWIVSTPHIMLQNAGLIAFKKSDFSISKSRVGENLNRLRGKRIIFMLPTNGRNLKTVANTASSVIYWRDFVSKNYDDALIMHSWIVCEEDDYAKDMSSYEALSSRGCRVIVVPKAFRTEKGTQYKARALMYAMSIMEKEGLATKDTWIYHQDDETVVGEDTLLGIMDFIENAGPSDVYAAGIIIYADGWESRASRTQEPARTYDDLRILITTRTRGLLSFGHHGSHLLVRADAERRIGWDFGRVKTEDWLFGLKLWQEYSPEKTVLKGFAYEKPPLNARDLMRQRRRWAQGALQIIRRRDVRLRYRLAALYGVVSWLSAFPSLVAFFLNIANPTGGLFVGSGFLAGFTWFSLYKYYGNGYVLNKPYLQNFGDGLGSKIRRTFAIIGGMLLESIAPWYALLRPAKNFEVIKKDEER
jgi:hypothetical protein